MQLSEERPTFQYSQTPVSGKPVASPQAYGDAQQAEQTIPQVAKSPDSEALALKSGTVLQSPKQSAY